MTAEGAGQGRARARFHHELVESHLARTEGFDRKSETFTSAIDEREVAHARLMDGKLLLVATAADLAPEEVNKRSKLLANTELND